jgi:ectoine hydroxylase-related dioxygenase (phytanoyl-CoA dioxygenase family)
MQSESPIEVDRYAIDFAREGYSIHEGVISDREIDHLLTAVAHIPDGEEVRRKRGVYGVRNLLEICPATQSLARQANIRQFVTPVLGEGAFAVRAIYFDKVPGSNWSLFWHQDNVISVVARVEVAGYIGWSKKAGVWQVQPPAHVLANMLAVRVHLDDCGPENGPLRVLPGSHRFGWLEEELDDWKLRVQEVICTVGRGGVVTMCPLLLHASAKSAAAGHRRVIHIEYACDDLSEGLEWNNRVGPTGDSPLTESASDRRNLDARA